jgi:hypothetical protein
MQCKHKYESRYEKDVILPGNQVIKAHHTFFRCSLNDHPNSSLFHEFKECTKEEFDSLPSPEAESDEQSTHPPGPIIHDISDDGYFDL